MKSFICFLGIVFFFQTLIVQGQDSRQILEKRLREYQSKAPKERVLIINDKDIYASGESIWLTGFVYDMLTTRLSSLSDKLEVELHGNNDIKIIRKSMQLQNGVANGFIQIPLNLGEGVYYLIGSTSESDLNSSYKKKIVVREKVIPHFIIETQIPDRKFVAGDQLPMNILFKNFYNEPKKNVQFELKLYDGEKEVHKIEGKAKKGQAETIQLTVPNNLNSGGLTYEIRAESKGIEAAQKGYLPIVSDMVYADFYPENGKLINGLPTTVHCYISDAFGLPLALEANVVVGTKMICSLTTDKYGMGSFNLTPTIGQDYQLVMLTPQLSGKSFPLPAVVENGMTIKLTERSEDNLKLQLTSSNDEQQIVYLVGLSGKDIFWISEHQLSGKELVEVSLASASGRVGQFVLLDQSANILSEFVTSFNNVGISSLQVELLDENTSAKGKVEFSIQGPTEKGSFVFASINEPWVLEDLNVNEVDLMSWPFDIIKSLPLRQQSELKHVLFKGSFEKFINYYSPGMFGWNIILNTEGCFGTHKTVKQVHSNMLLYEEIEAFNSLDKNGDQLIQTNVTASDIFLLANPKYISKIFGEKPEKVPAYKTLLENGTPILEVIKTLKPYTMMGNKIVFAGSANSLLAQDGAIIAIDGVNRGSDASVIQSISPFDVERINVSTNPGVIQRYTALNSVGLVEIDLKKGKAPDEVDSDILPDDATFDSPDYEKNHGKSVDDKRSTLHWEVVENNAESGVYKVQFYNSDFISPVKCHIYFVPEVGQPILSEVEYQVR